MPKQVKSSTTKVRQIFLEYPDEFSATPDGDLQCNLCDVLVKRATKSFLWKAIEKVSNTKEICRRITNPKVSKPFYNSIQVNFKEHVVSLFLGADIPLHKLNHLLLKSLFATMGKVLLSETAARAYVAKLASQKKYKFKDYFVTKKFF